LTAITDIHQRIGLPTKKKLTALLKLLFNDAVNCENYVAFVTDK
jgi:hypothetical protein